MNPILIMMGIVIAFSLVMLGVFLCFISVWVRAMIAGAPIPMLVLIGMKLRRVPLGLVADAYIQLHRTDCPVSIGDVERVYLLHAGSSLTPAALARLVRAEKGTAAS